MSIRAFQASIRTDRNGGLLLLSNIKVQRHGLEDQQRCDKNHKLSEQVGPGKKLKGERAALFTFVGKAVAGDVFAGRQ